MRRKKGTKRRGEKANGMDDAAFRMHIVKPEEDLLRDLLDNVLGYSTVLISLDEAEQVLSEDLEDHADVGPVGPLLAEMVQKLHYMASAGMPRIG
jgi:hypothetical protein